VNFFWPHSGEQDLAILRHRVASVGKEKAGRGDGKTEMGRKRRKEKDGKRK
jgi:hypothetical protein